MVDDVSGRDRVDTPGSGADLQATEPVDPDRGAQQLLVAGQLGAHLATQSGAAFDRGGPEPRGIRVAGVLPVGADQFDQSGQVRRQDAVGQVVAVSALEGE
jgi:hypothetical protein